MMKRMAVLWQQRELVFELDKLEKENAQKKAAQLSGETNAQIKEIAKEFYLIGQGDNWIYKLELINRVLEKRGKNADIGEGYSIKRVLRACINDGFIEKKDNEYFFLEDVARNQVEKLSAIRIQVSPGKGSEILNHWYFWMKYMPEVLKPIEQIIVQVVIAVIIALITTFITLSFMR